MPGRSERLRSALPALCLGLVALAGLSLVGNAFSAAEIAHGISTAAVNDVRADTTDRDTQSVPALVDLGGGDLVAAFTESGEAAAHRTGYAYSSNYGFSWTDGGALPESVGGDFGSPSLAYNPHDGRVYLATPANKRENIRVFASLDRGHTWLPPANGTPGASGDIQDRPSIAVDNFTGAGQGGVYLCSTRFAGGSSDAQILLTRSLDGGATFLPPGGTLISRGGNGCSVVVSPNQVSVFYYRGTGPGGQGGDNKLFLRRSLDRGATFLPETAVADLGTTAANGDLRLNGGLGSNSFASAAAGPGGLLYVVFNDDPSPADPTDNGDIFLTYSANGGATWARPVRVNDDVAGDQFSSAVALTPDGRQLMVSYYSRTQDPSNLMFHRRARLATLNSAGAPVFNPSFQLGPNTPPIADNDPEVAPAGMGGAIAGSDNAFSLTWSDNRRQNASGRYQSDVAFARISAEPATTDLRVSTSQSTETLKVGQSVKLTVTAAASGGAANDAFLNIMLGPGLRFESYGADAHCDAIDGFVGCSLGSIASGTAKAVQLIATATAAGPTASLPITVTTSSLETNTRNNTSLVRVEVSTNSVTGDQQMVGNVPGAAATPSPLALAGPGAVYSTLVPTADTYVDETQKTTAFGASATMVAKTVTGFTRYAYAQFDTGALPGAVVSATLRLSLRANGSSYPDPGSFAVREFTNNAWSEASTWNTRPSDAGLGAQLASRTLPITQTQVMAIDVTSYVTARRAAGSPVVSFTIRAAQAKNSGVIIDTREGTVPPELVLVTQAAPTCTLAADPASIDQGDAATLSWTATGAASGSIDNGVGEMTPIDSGSIPVVPAATTIYTATVTGSDGQQGACSVTVEVIPPPPPPPTCMLAADPPTIGQGGAATLSWTTTGAASGSIDNGVGAMTPIDAGSIGVQPAVTTTYTATVSALDGQQGVCSAAVTVENANTSPAPVLVGQTPLNPVPLSPPPIAGLDGPYEMIVSGNHAYVTNERLGSFAVFDVSDPADPTFVAESPRPGINGRGLAIVGDNAYLADPVDDSISIFDISDPAVPLFLSKLKNSTLLNGARSLSVSGDYAYVANTDANSLAVVDVSNKLQPTIVATTQGPVPGSSLARPTDITLSGTYVYVASTGAGGLAILDVSQPANPTFVSAVPCPGGNSAGVHGVKVVGSYAYVACAANASFGVIDVSDPTTPVVIGSTRGPEPGQTFAAAFHLYVLGNYAYVTLSQFDGTEGKVVVVDVSDPANPTAVGQTSQIKEARAVYASGRYLYAGSDAWDAIMVFDVGAAAETPPPTCTLDAPAVIGQGESATLSWTSSGARAGAIDHDAGAMNPIASGSEDVVPEITTAYRATVVDAAGQRGACGVTVAVIPAPGNGISLAPIADTYVSQASPKTSYGSSVTLVTKTASSTIRHAYLKFDTASFAGPVISAKLRLSLQANGDRFADPGQFSAFEYLGNSWTESTTWNTRPSDTNLGKYLASKTLPITAPEFWEIDVTNYIKAQRAAGAPIVSFSIRSYGAGGVHIDSRESANPPELLLIRSGAANSTALLGEP